MKRFLFIVSAVLFAASCMNNGEYTETYTVTTHFTYADGVYSSQFGADSVFFDKSGGFPWGDIAFMNKVDDAGEFKGGFLLSHLEAPGFGAKDKDYEVNPNRCAGKPLSKNNTYAVYHMASDPSYMPENDITFLSKKYGTCEVDYCWVNNTEEVFEAAKSFETGDKLVLTATGYLNGAMTGEAEITLATPDSTMYNWTKFNLEKLGTIDAIDFELYASRSGIPTSFCLDELYATVNIKY